jgi:hypothetical protein
MNTVASPPSIQHVLYAGIFSDERVLQVLHILQTLSDNCFSKLHEVANEGQPSSGEYAIRFRKGLDSIEFWKQNIKNEETKQAIEKYKELPILYKYAIVRYLQELFKHDNRRVIPVSAPPLQDFIHSYYLKLAKSSYMQKLEFLKVYGLERTHMHMEALRSVLMDFARDSIYDAPSSSSVMGDRIQDYRPVENHIRGLRGVERDVTPGDSVSQRGDRPFQDEFQHTSSRRHHHRPRHHHHQDNSDNDSGDDSHDRHRNHREKHHRNDASERNPSPALSKHSKHSTVRPSSSGNGRGNADRPSGSGNGNGDRPSGSGSGNGDRPSGNADRSIGNGNSNGNTGHQNRKTSQPVQSTQGLPAVSTEATRPTQSTQGYPVVTTSTQEHPVVTTEATKIPEANQSNQVPKSSAPLTGLEIVKEEKNNSESDSRSADSVSKRSNDTPRSPNSPTSPTSPTSLHTIHIPSNRQQVFE